METTPDTIRSVLSAISAQKEHYQPFDTNGNLINDFDAFILKEPRHIMIHKVVVKRILGIFKTTVYREVAFLSLPEHDDDPWVIRRGIYFDDHDTLNIRLLVTVIENRCGIHIKYS
jgi:hypothetical protein